MITRQFISKVLIDWTQLLVTPEVELERYAVVINLLDLQTSMENGGLDPRVESLGLLSARLCFSQMAFTASPAAPQPLRDLPCPGRRALL